jgi:hypothetical protein
MVEPRYSPVRVHPARTLAGLTFDLKIFTNLADCTVLVKVRQIVHRAGPFGTPDAGLARHVFRAPHFPPHLAQRLEQNQFFLDRYVVLRVLTLLEQRLDGFLLAGRFVVVFDARGALGLHRVLYVVRVAVFRLVFRPAGGEGENIQVLYVLEGGLTDQLDGYGLHPDVERALGASLEREKSLTWERRTCGGHFDKLRLRTFPGTIRKDFL